MISLGDDFGRFATALKAFGARPFFSRMWIYQEVFLASNMNMLFGAQVAKMQALQDVTNVCSCLMMSYRPQSEYDYKDAQLKLNELLTSHDLLVQVGHDSDLSALRLLVDQLQPRDRTGKAVAFGDVRGRSRHRAGARIDLTLTVSGPSRQDLRHHQYVWVFLHHQAGLWDFVFRTGAEGFA